MAYLLHPKRSTAPRLHTTHQHDTTQPRGTFIRSLYNVFDGSRKGKLGDPQTLSQPRLRWPGPRPRDGPWRQDRICVIPHPGFHDGFRLGSSKARRRCGYL